MLPCQTVLLVSADFSRKLAVVTIDCRLYIIHRAYFVKRQDADGV